MSSSDYIAEIEQWRQGREDELRAGDGSIDVDFNKAYNPPCAFTPYATCPLPPAANILPVRIEAGERCAQAN